MQISIAIRIAGKASQVFKLLSSLTKYRGSDTIGKIVDEKRTGTVFLPGRGS